MSRRPTLCPIPPGCNLMLAHDLRLAWDLWTAFTFVPQPRKSHV
jgi:hypothetical protein